MSAICKIERLANGYEVEITDPKIVEQNKKGKGGYKNPDVSYAFKTVQEVLSFLGKNLKTAMPMDEYESSFDMAATKEEENDDE
tara:strand:+ start:1080 stop:1331 length:252 start_codon:yes stop_codon:yes gene_type:complete